MEKQSVARSLARRGCLHQDLSVLGRRGGSPERPVNPHHSSIAGRPQMGLGAPPDCRASTGAYFNWSVAGSNRGAYSSFSCCRPAP